MRWRSGLVVALLSVLAALVGAPTSVRAQDEGLGASYVTPFPTGDVYQVAVIGDWLAEGVLDGLVELMGGDARLQIQRRRWPLMTLLRSEHVEDIREIEQRLKKETVNVAVVMLGVQDRTSIRTQSGKRAPVGSDEWKGTYVARVDKLMKVLKQASVAVYWVGLPVMRRADANEDAQVQNEVFRERAYLNGIKFIDSFAGFADEQGGYSAHGPDVTGKQRLLRDDDGIHFTEAGNRKLAYFVERELSRDLTQARNERSVPLAGSESEQARINPAKAAATQGVRGPQAADAGKAGQWGAAVVPAVPPAAAGSEQKAENSRIALKTIGAGGREEVLNIEIVRPAIPASIIAHVARRESPDKPSAMGDQIADQISSGLTVLSSITPASDGGGLAKAKMSPAQTPYFRVLVKGERPAPRKGRADDHSWPRFEEPAPAAAGAAEPPPASAVTPPPRPQSGRSTRPRG
ncbi:MAG: DUF459 domain-containing protein [Pseudomonadota bacterium]